MLSASTDAGASLNVQGPETISQQTGSGLYSQYSKYLTGSGLSKSKTDAMLGHQVICFLNILRPVPSYLCFEFVSLE